MKKIAFSKLTKYGYRPGFPGYLLEHSAHPTRKFVAARPSAPRNESRPLEGYKTSKGWAIYELESGAPLHFSETGFLRAPTLATLEDKARSCLFSVSEEQLAACIEQRRVYVATRMLKGETP